MKVTRDETHFNGGGMHFDGVASRLTCCTYALWCSDECRNSSGTCDRGWRSCSSAPCRSSSSPSATHSSSVHWSSDVARPYSYAHQLPPRRLTNTSSSWRSCASPPPDSFSSARCPVSSCSSASRTGTSPRGKTRRTRYNDSDIEQAAHGL